MTPLENVINNALRRKGLQKSELMEMLGMTYAGYDKAVKKGTLKVDALKIISKELEISMEVLLGQEERNQEENEGEGCKAHVRAMQEHIETLKEQVKWMKELFNQKFNQNE
jgi:hypothetical protein